MSTSTGTSTNNIVIAVLREQATGEQRVSSVPEVVQKLTKSGFEVRVEHDAGAGAFYPDELYGAAGAKIVSGREEL
ncbi:MAG TPA: NAD(P)(+) transhydrogenase (Re/Si-specific) subunit alpha, partial [Methanomicrobiales archaeon]|nr:NAD(P)(+) transhydrogenase (Re/Si-specific) subunit alpha [Methanomicrobiales archaeon]